jgi:hypothetical protein
MCHVRVTVRKGEGLLLEVDNNCWQCLGYRKFQAVASFTAKTINLSDKSSF